MEPEMVALLKMPARIGPADDQDNRRLFPRKECHAEVEGRRVDHSVIAHRFPRFTLAVRDLSYGGLSAISPTPLECGERLAVYFPKQGELREWDAVGRVLRCDTSSMGYRVAVEFDPLLAA
jgi:hypothetical protein